MPLPDPRVATHDSSEAMVWLARAGLVARGVVYGVMGVLAVEIATGHGSGQQANQKGALAAIAARSAGEVILAVLAVGLAAYALWQLAQAIWGKPSDKSVGVRLRSLAGAVGYGLLCATAVQVLVSGAGTGQDQQQEDITAKAMRHTAERWLIGVIGVVIFVVGVFLLVEGVRRTFLNDLDTRRMGHRTERAVTLLGVVGGIARGLVVGLAGVLVIDAAATADPQKSTGLDGALRTLAQHSFGPWLLGLTAAGVIAFGIFSVASAAWVRD